MIIDIVFAILLLLAFYNGYKKGLIYAILSFIAIFLGILLAMNFSTYAATWLSKSFTVPSAFLPILSFVLVLIMVIVCVKIVAIITEKILKTIMLNFVNKIAGGLLYGVILTLVFSVVLWFGNQFGVFTESSKLESMAFQHIAPFGPAIFDFAGSIIPMGKQAFLELNETIKEVANQQK